MRKDSIKNAKLHYEVSGRIELGLKYLENTDFSKVENGRYEILGDEVYALVQEYDSKPKEQGKFEAHRRYIDIQYIVDGEEQMGVADVNDFSELAPYDETKDIVFFQNNDDANQEFICLKAGEFIVFDTCDAHMPSIAIENPSHVKKVVVKALA